MTWYTEMSVLAKVMFYIAAIASVFLLIQIIMMLFSFGGMDDVDCPNCGDVDPDCGLPFFSVKSITAFFTLGGWCGFATATYVENSWAPILVAVLTGTVALFGVGFAMKGISKLQCSGNLDPDKLKGRVATVYVSVPSNRKGRGKITLTAQGKYMEIDAVTDENTPIVTDEEVTILSYSDDFAVVQRKQA